MRKIILAGIISVLSISLVGCFGDKEVVDESKPQVESQGNENNENVKPEEEKPDDKTPPKEEVEKPKDEEIKNPPKEENEKPKEEDKTPGVEESEKPKEEDKTPVEEDKTERVFKINTLNIDEKKVSGGEIKTVGLGVAENIKKILETVSEKYFDGEKLELTTIETIGDKKIAVVNLGGDKKYWEDRMQGSTGGRITSYTLIENVLQRGYTGYWVNGVKFTLNNKPLQDTGHATDLTRISYR